MQRRRLMAPLLVAVVSPLAAGCVAHPVGPARTYGKYEGKAVTTAESALSAVQTARVAVGAAVRHDIFGPYLGTVIGESEDAVAGVSGTFASIQPPDGQADRLRGELGDLLSDAEDHLAEVRIAARRGRHGDLDEVSKPLAADAHELEKFAEEHGG